MVFARPCLALALSFAAAAPGSAACLTSMGEHQVEEGTLTSKRFRDEAYRRTEHAYILQLRNPACLEGPGDFDKVEKSDTIHLFPLDAAVAKRMRGLLGKLVRVHGQPFGEHTVHHHAPIVMRTDKIEQLGR